MGCKVVIEAYDLMNLIIYIIYQIVFAKRFLRSTSRLKPVDSRASSREAEGKSTRKRNAIFQIPSIS